MSTKKADIEKVSNVPPFGLRMLPELKEQIAASAAEAGRSLNAEIVRRLEDSLKKPAAIDEADVIGDAYVEQKQLTSEYKSLAKQRDHLLRAVCLQMLMYGDQIPAEAKVLAEKILGDEFEPRLDDENFREEAEARHNKHLRYASYRSSDVFRGRSARHLGAILSMWSEFERYLINVATKKRLRVVFSGNPDAAISVIKELIKAGDLSRESERNFLTLKQARDDAMHGFENGRGMINAREFEKALAGIKSAIEASTASPGRRDQVAKLAI